MEARALGLFPYRPYGIQEEFVHEIAELFAAPRRDERANIGIFESPTGTGKTTSLLCGSLAWIECGSDERPKENTQVVNSQSALFAPEEPDWVREARRELPAKSSVPKPIAHRKRQKKALAIDVDGSVSNLLALIAGDSDVDDDADFPPSPARRVFYCSRTHSQLSQVMSELQRIIKTSTPTPIAVRAITMGSRKTLCINDTVNRLGSAERINEKCHELLSHDDCPYYNHDKDVDMKAFLGTLPPVADVEELLSRGKSQCVCPYYAARALRAEIVTLPYNLILDRVAREAAGIDLTEAVVIFDEAHNLVGAINELNSSSVSQEQLMRIVGGLRRYIDRFRGRLAPDNAVKVQQLLHLTSRILEFLHSNGSADADTSSSITISDFLSRCQIDHVNFLPIIEYTRATNLSPKLATYYRCGDNDNGNNESSAASDPNALHTVESLLNALAMANSDGRLIFRRDKGMATIKYVALNPAIVMESIIEQAHTVILAGGTMSPLDDMVAQLFPAGVTPKCFSFDHLIPPENVLGLLTVSGPTGGAAPFKFVHSRRDDRDMFLQLGQLIINVCNVVPSGVVVFFPSYQLLDHFLAIWPGPRKQVKKSLFVESPSSTSDLDQFMRRYAHDCHGERGALLLAVMGGRLSEGVNFADRLARAVLLVGLPYPNPHDPETMLRAAHYASIKAMGREDAMNEFYENIAMRTVNQTIGRAIRHRDDYAAIMLIDERYQQPRIRAKLSRWFMRSLKAGKRTMPEMDFPTSFHHIVQFFRQRK